jgi:plastocyanin
LSRRIAGAAGLVVLAVAASWVAGGGLTSRLELEISARSHEGSDFAFAPDPLVAPASTALTLTFRNATAAPHTLILLGPIDVRTTAAVSAGGAARLDFTTPTAGTYRFVCNVHEGMAGTLEVR